MKLEVGMYVKTEEGLIGKIIEIDDDYYTFDNCIYKNFEEYYDSCSLENIHITKATHEIIELIEIGDFVNGYKIVAIEQDYFNGKLVLITEKWETNWQGDRSLVMFHNEDICSVLTKEQYEKMSYKLEREEN